MNHAFADASWHEVPESAGMVGLGGWGLVLVRPGWLPARFQGQLRAPDNNVAELRAVLEAVAVAPAAEGLTVHTDNQAVITALGRGRGSPNLTQGVREVLDLAQRRGVTLRVGYAPRTRRHMRVAHELANAARQGLDSPALHAAFTDVLLEQRAAWSEARLSVRRPAERIMALVPLSGDSDVPPSVQALLAAVSLALPGEVLQVRRASKLARALWERPERALRAGVQAQVRAAREAADLQGVRVEFVGMAGT